MPNEEKKPKSVTFEFPNPQDQDTDNQAEYEALYGGDGQKFAGTERKQGNTQQYQRRNSKTQEMLGEEIGASLRKTVEQSREKREFDELSQSLEISTISTKTSKRRKTEKMEIEPEEWQQRVGDRSANIGERSPG